MNGNEQGAIGFGVNPGELFDETRHTQGNQMHLMEHIWGKLRSVLERQRQQRIAAGKPAGSVADALKAMTALQFVKFASDYLKAARGIETFFVDENIGLRLTDGSNVALSPGVPVRGTMQLNRSVPITSGQGQPYGNVDDGSSFPL